MKNIKKYVGLLAGTLAVTTVVYGGRNGKSEEESSQENKKHIQKKPRLSETNSYRAIANSRFGVTPASFTPSTAQLKFGLSQLKLNLPVDMQKNHATHLLPNLRTGQVMHDERKHYTILPRLLETNTSQQTRTNTMSAFRPVPEHQRHLYSVMSTNNQNTQTPSSTKFELKKTITVHTINMQTDIRHSTKPQNTLRTTQSNALQSHSFCLSKEKSKSLESSGRSFLESLGFTISEISESTPIDIMKKCVKEHNLNVSFDDLEDCLLSQSPYHNMSGFFTKLVQLLNRSIVYFTPTSAILYEPDYGQRYHTTNLNIGVGYLEKYPNAIIVFRESKEAFYLVTPPNEQ